MTGPCVEITSTDQWATETCDKNMNVICEKIEVNMAKSTQNIGGEFNIDTIRV